MAMRSIALIMLVAIFGFFFIFSYSHSSSIPSISPATALLMTPVVLEFAATPGEFVILSPEVGEGVTMDRELTVQLHQVGDASPIQKVWIKVDNAEWFQLTLSDVSIESIGTAGRIITLGSSFAWRPNGVNYLGDGEHTLKVKMKTALPNEIESPETTYRLVTTNQPGFFEDGESASYASFSSAMGLDCNKRKLCTREVVYYIPMLPNDPISYEAKVAKAEAAVKDSIDKVLKYACVFVSVKYKALTIPAGAKGINPTTGVVTNVEDFFHELHTNDKAKTTDALDNPITFNKEMNSWKKDGAIPVIGANDVVATHSAVGGSISGLTFKKCNGTMLSDKGKPTGKCGTNSKVFAIVTARDKGGILAHELGHRMFEDKSWPISGTNGKQQHHDDDYKDKDSDLEVSNFMRYPQTSGTLTISTKQATGLYESCTENGGALGVYKNSSVNYCMDVSNVIIISASESVCYIEGGGSGNQNEESCYGNTQLGKWKPKVPSNFKPPSQGGVDACGEDCGPGLQCNLSTCHCYPASWPSPDGPVGSPSGGPSGSTGTPKGGSGSGGTTTTPGEL